MRADFSRAVGRSLAHRVGLHCSNPECRAYTSGPQSDPQKAVNIGVAAHITAASVSGPRYDATLIDRERRSATNGIWLCQTCAKLIDSDVRFYTTDLLRRWKIEAEREAAARIGKTNRRTSRAALKTEEEIKRNLRLRDDLTRAFLKPPADLMTTDHRGAQL